MKMIKVPFPNQLRGRQMLTRLTKGGGGGWEMLTRAYKWGRGVGDTLTMADKGGSRGLDPPIFG